MGRPREGWRLKKPKGRKFHSVVFTVGGRQREFGTGESDAERAAPVAERIYADALAGRFPERARKRERSAVVGRPLGEAGASWLSEVDGTLLDVETAKTYSGYFSTHLGPFFGTLEAVTTERGRQYVSARLRSVKGATVRKELSCLRGLLAWAFGDSAPLLPSVPKRAHGTAHKQGKRQATELSPAEVRRLLAAVSGSLARAFLTLMYETTLRPASLRLIAIPEHYRKGSAELHIPSSADKNRMGRVVPLSLAARRALDSVATPGTPFASVSVRRPFQRAAERTLGHKAETAHPYDLKRAGITHRLERTANLPGVQYLAGHKSAATTAKYNMPSMRAARAAVSVARKRSH